MPITTRRSSEYTTPARTDVEAVTAKEPPEQPSSGNTVTPLEPLPQAQEETPQQEERETADESSSKRGTVSKRGRYVSPARRSSSSSAGPKQTTTETFRSPPRTGDGGLTAVVSTGTTDSTKEEEKKEQPKNAVSFSQAEDIEEKKQEPKSPPRTNLVSFPKLEDGKLNSPGGMFVGPSTPKRREEEEEKKEPARRDHVSTPTDFATDYGKQNNNAAAFDNSNVLAWLQSPTAHGLFSPGGGFGSVMNSPNARTPRTPTVSTSFFFSDVAGLPRGDLTPGKKSSKNGVICISPMAYNKGRGGTHTPMNLKDVFSSPREKAHIRSLPMLSDTPLKGRPRVPQRSGSKDPSLDAHMAERELMEDEDLTVLLQLASNSTPRPSAGPVFRSPNGRRDDENLPGLQLPMIGGKTDDSKLHPKPSSVGHPGKFLPPQLEMRSASGSGEMLSKSKSDKSSEKKAAEPKAASRPSAHPYLNYGQEMPPFYAMPPNIPPGAAGSMRVVVGGPPPRNSAGKSGTPPMGGNSPHGMPPMYDYPPGMPPYGPPGMYSQYPPPMGYGPYQGHYPPPPPRQMTPFGSQPQPQHLPGSSGKKGVKTPKSGVKRASPLMGLAEPGTGSAQKKARKSPGSGKKKNRSPQITDKMERAKAAQRIMEVNLASGGKNDKAAALAAAILRGVTMRPSGKWQAQLYFAGKSRYIGVFDTREKAALAYEIAREKLKNGPKGESGNPKATENLVNAARKAAFDGVNEKLA